MQVTHLEFWCSRLAFWSRNSQRDWADVRPVFIMTSSIPQSLHFRKTLMLTDVPFNGSKASVTISIFMVNKHVPIKWPFGTVIWHPKLHRVNWCQLDFQWPKHIWRVPRCRLKRHHPSSPARVTWRDTSAAVTLRKTLRWSTTDKTWRSKWHRCHKSFLHLDTAHVHYY